MTRAVPQQVKYRDLTHRALGFAAVPVALGCCRPELYTPYTFRNACCQLVRSSTIFANSLRAKTGKWLGYTVTELSIPDKSEPLPCRCELAKQTGHSLHVPVESPLNPAINHVTGNMDDTATGVTI